jgi:hypothetical protein
LGTGKEELLQNGHLMEVHFVKDTVENVAFISIYGWILFQLIFGDRCMSGLCMEYIVTMVQADREHVWSTLEAS